MEISTLEKKKRKSTDDDEDGGNGALLSFSNHGFVCSVRFVAMRSHFYFIVFLLISLWVFCFLANQTQNVMLSLAIKSREKRVSL